MRISSMLFVCLLLACGASAQTDLLDSIGHKNFYPAFTQETPTSVFYFRMLRAVVASPNKTFPVQYVVEKSWKSPLKVLAKNFTIGDTITFSNEITRACMQVDGGRLHLFYYRTRLYDTVLWPPHKYVRAIYYQQLDTNLNVVVPERMLYATNHREQFDLGDLTSVAVVNDRILLTYYMQDTTGPGTMSKAFLLRNTDGMVIHHDTIPPRPALAFSGGNYMHYAIEGIAYPGNKILFAGQGLCNGQDGFSITDTALKLIDTFLYSYNFNTPLIHNGGYLWIVNNVIALPTGSLILGGSFATAASSIAGSALSKHKAATRFSGDTVVLFQYKDSADGQHGFWPCMKSMAYNATDHLAYRVDNTHYNLYPVRGCYDSSNYLELMAVDTTLHTGWRKFIYSGHNRCLSIHYVTSCIGRGGILLGGVKYSISNPQDPTAYSPFLYRIDSATITSLSARNPDIIIRDRFRIYPNPAKDALFIDDILKSVSAATVIDLQGRAVLQAPVTANPARISLQSLPPATYLLRLSLKDGSTHSQLFSRQE